MANESNHTPGPWGWEYSAFDGKPITLSNETQDVLIATTDLDDRPYIDISDANACLIRQSPKMLALLEKALPIIRAEADRRDAAPVKVAHGYWTEMDNLANEISAEIDRAYGREVKSNG